MGALNEEAVIEIRSSRGVPANKLAAKFGVSTASIVNVWTGKTWKNVGKPLPAVQHTGEPDPEEPVTVEPVTVDTTPEDKPPEKEPDKSPDWHDGFERGYAMGQDEGTFLCHGAARKFGAGNTRIEIERIRANPKPPPARDKR